MTDIMNSSLTPQEKLYCAIFGSEVRLSPEGNKAVENVLKRFEEKAKFGERGVRVIRLRYGFEPRTAEEKARRPNAFSDARTYVEVGVYFGVTRERIRQIEARTLRILRHPSYSRELKPNYEIKEVNNDRTKTGS